MKWWWIIACGLLTFSCSKKQESNEEVKTNLPHFSKVDAEDIFTKEDNSVANEDSLKNLLQEYYQNTWVGGDLSGGILIAKGDNIIFEQYRGYGRENQQMPINQNTPLHIASISKTMTAMAIMKLIEAKKIKLDQDITTFFPKFPYANIRVIDLLSHRSGLPKYEHFIETLEPKPKELSQSFLTNQDILNLLIRYKPELARPTGTGFMYCNTNYALLALIIEKVTQKDYPTAMKEMLFAPLEMKHTFVFQQKDIATAAQSFYYKNNKLHPLNNLDLIYGDKNIYTTPRDLLKFSQAMFSKEFLPSDLKEKIFTPYSNEKKGINNYGLGFRMKNFDNNKKLTYHNGWWHGSNSVFVHLLDSKVSIIAIGNKFSSRVYSAVALSGLFDDFPLETEILKKEMMPNASNAPPSSSSDSLQ
ncbi:serine hydrolase [Riemerella anatipestifer]|uniref:serine hydrolase domain-containing protein n=1 Tax=Riemerella anatipestifer TaxID=34085 RepID=UPI002A8E8F30|nr:serine hydrolase [Riemerella anatipestifer]